MLAALENFNQLSSNRKVLFLGDMFELGDSAEFEHQAVVDFVEANFTSDIYFFGSNFYSTTTSNKSTKFETLDSAVKILSALNLRNCNHQGGTHVSFYSSFFSQLYAALSLSSAAHLPERPAWLWLAAVKTTLNMFSQVHMTY